jgi:hypothetical protein
MIFSSLAYPYWLMIAGAVVLVVALAFRPTEKK